MQRASILIIILWPNGSETIFKSGFYLPNNTKLSPPNWPWYVEERVNKEKRKSEFEKKKEMEKKRDEQKLTLDSPIEKLLEKCKLQVLKSYLVGYDKIEEIGLLDVNDESFKDVKPKIKKILSEYVSMNSVL